MVRSRRTLTGLPYDAVLVDLDGVVTDTAATHRGAWAALFDPILSARGLGPFDPAVDYPQHLDGRTREDGIVNLLASRGIDIARGTAADPLGAFTAFGLGKQKNAMFLSRISAEGVRVYPGTVALLQRLRDGRVPVGLVSSSRNAHAVIDAAKVGDMFDTVVDGDIASLLHLAGKPDPGLFLEAARRLGVAPERSVIIEDAVAGVEAGRRGGFGLIAGVDRSGMREALEAAGADVVVDDVGELDLGESRVHAWKLAYEGFDPAHEGHREALTALGNGYMATRGANPESRDDTTHYPATYLAGVYNTSTSLIEGVPVVEEQLVNIANWLPLDLRIGERGWWSRGSYAVSDERRELDLRTGVLERSLSLGSESDGRIDITQRRFVSMDNPHLAVLETILTPRGYDGVVTIKAGIDTDIRNANVARDKAHGSRHLSETRSSRPESDVILCESETTSSRIRIAIALQVTVSGADHELIGSEPAAGGHRHELTLQLRTGSPVTVTKTAAIFTSRDGAISSPGEAALAELRRIPDSGPDRTSGLLARHASAWRRLWDGFAIEIDADRHCQLVLNLHTFHTLQSISAHTATLDAGVPARGLHGEGYRGHVFWDEVFVLPVIGLRTPQVTRALLEYRWRRLPAARHIARTAGARGASFPWQSASDGTEQTPTSSFSAQSKRWIADNSSLQKHVGLVVAYDAWQYFQMTGDETWLAERGAELIIEVARFFASIARFRSEDGRAHIDGVMGPDEYHDGYPDAPGRGLRDNTYTNVLAAWVCERAIDCLEALDGHAADAVRDRLAIAPDEVAAWGTLSTTLAVPLTPDGLLDQFDGFHLLDELDWGRYRARFQDLGRIDLILEAEDDSALRYKLTKQPDVLMLLYLLGRNGLIHQLELLGCALTADDLDRTIEYYLSRTVHGSTLSRVALAAILADIDSVRAWSVYRAALVADLDDTQGGTTSEGIHLGAMAGTAGLTIHSFAGLRTERNTLHLEPHLPSRLRRLRFEVWYRGHRVDVTIDAQGATVSLASSTARPMHVVVNGLSATMRGGERRRFPARTAAA